MEVKKISFDEFEERFIPQKNTRTPEQEAFDGCMYQCFGRDLEVVSEAAKKTPYNVWTILDVDGRIVICEGFHVVNRDGYLITKNAFQYGEMFDIEVEDDLNVDDDESADGTNQEFLVTWTIDVTASDEVMAAKLALSCMPQDGDRENLAQLFMVSSAAGITCCVDLSEDDPESKVVEPTLLPFGITVTDNTLQSNIRKEFEIDGVLNGVFEESAGEASAEALESFLLALHCEGVDIHTPAFAKALQSSVTAVAEHLS